MRANEAMDFLVAQTEEQARLEGIPLSDLEKRMMYFTEGKEAREDPTALNEEFEAKYETGPYERKISGLLGRAYKRLKKHDRSGALKWSLALRTLRRGDHYLLVMAGNPLKHASFRERLAYGFLFAVILSPILVLWLLAPRRDGTFLWGHFPLPNPHVLQALFLIGVFTCIFLPGVFARPVDWVFDLFERILGEKEEEG